MGGIKEIDDCIDRVKRSDTINAVGDVKESLQRCAKKLVEKKASITPAEFDHYKKMINDAYFAKSSEIEKRYGEKGDVYGYSPQDKRAKMYKRTAGR